jgi:hypothetical protein
MRCLPFLLVMAVSVAAGYSRAAADELDREKLRTRCIDTSALVFGPDGTKDPAPLAGALILDQDKRLLLAPEHNLPDAATVLFPAYTAKGELRNKTDEYTDLWKKGDRWAGKVTHRDKFRGLAVIELERALPDRARPAQFSRRSTATGAILYAIQFSSDRDEAWGIVSGKVRQVGKVPTLGTGAGPHPPGLMMVSSTAPRLSGPECGLFDELGRVVGFDEVPIARPGASTVTLRLDVAEVRAFLTENKVPFQSAPDEPGAKDAKSK